MEAHDKTKIGLAYTIQNDQQIAAILLGQEEGKIRTDVEHQVTSLLQEVFGGN